MRSKQQRQESRDRRQRAVTVKGWYDGSHPDYPKEAQGLPVTFDDDGVTMYGGFKTYLIAWTDIVNVEVLDGGATDRITASRVAALGPFALAARKREQATFVVVETAGGQLAIRVKELGATELRLKLRPFLGATAASA